MSDCRQVRATQAIAQGAVRRAQSRSAALLPNRESVLEGASEIVAWRLLWLTYEARQNPQRTVEGILETHEWQSLYCRIHKTTKIPNQVPTLGECVRWIAQLGGFLGRKGDGDPGVKTLWRGLQRLHDISETWYEIAKKTVEYCSG